LPYVHARQSWKRQPTRPYRIDYSHPLAKGLRSFYDLRFGSWRINQVDGSCGGTIVNNGPTFNQHGLVTTGDTANYAKLDPGFTLTAPLTFISSQRYVSGVVEWSAGTTTQWNGYYTDSGTNCQVSASVDFSGTIAPAASSAFPVGFRHLAWSLVAANNLRGTANGGVIATDTSVNVPASGANSVYLGNSWGSDNPAVVWMEFWGVYNRALTDGELIEVSRNPWQMCRPISRRIYVNTAAAPGGTVFPAHYYQQQRRQAA
jgi:hypothetical protein